MPLRISADTTLRVDTNHDGSLTLQFERKRPLEAETTSIEATEITDADVTADVTAGADNDAFTLKRHKTSVFDEKMALAKSLVAPPGATTRERQLSSACSSHDARSSQAITFLNSTGDIFFTLSPRRGSVLSIAQALDLTFPTIKLGKLAGLKILNDRKVALQAKKMREKQRTGRLAIRDGQQALPTKTPRFRKSGAVDRFFFK